MQGICLPSPGNHKSLPSPLTPLLSPFYLFFPLSSPLSPFPLILRVVIIIFCPFRSPLLPPLLQSVSLCCFHIPFYLQLSSFCSCHFLLSPCIFYPPPLFMLCTLLSLPSSLSSKFLPYVCLQRRPLFVVAGCVSLQPGCLGAVFPSPEGEGQRGISRTALGGVGVAL